MELLLADMGLLGVGVGLVVLGAGLAVVGAGIGIGRTGGDASQAMARQPQLAGAISRNMLISATLIEGVAIFAVVIAFLAYVALTGRM